VGSFAVQLAVAAGLRATAVAGTDDEEWVRALGAATVLPRDTQLSTIGSFSYVLDAVPVGAHVFPAVADGGTIVRIASRAATCWRNSRHASPLTSSGQSSCVRLGGSIRLLVV
jgi:NADPH:quinone reductase-like Zn-dependent oxidoreductase